MRQASFNLRRYNSKTKPHLKWVVTGGRGNGGKPSRKFFKIKADAELYLQQRKTDAANLGLRAASIPDGLKIEALKAAQQLQPYGRTLTDAVEHYIQHLEQIEKSETVSNLVEPFLERKRLDGLSERYLGDLSAKMNKFKERFGDEHAATITTQALQNWIDGMKVSPITQNNFRRVIGVFFSWCIKNHYAASSPVADIAEKKVKDSPVPIFTPKEVVTTLNYASEEYPELIPFLALGFFAGIRTAEIERMKWGNVLFDSENILVDAASSKSARKRFVPIRENLAQWIAPYRQQDKKSICPGKHKDTLDDFRAGLKKAKSMAWPQNGMRHSYASYTLALEKDAGKLAIELGHTDTKLIFKNYRELVPEREGKKYWKINPLSSAENIIKLPA